MEDDRTDLLDALEIMTGDRYNGVGARFMPGGNKYASGFSIEFVDIEAESPKPLNDVLSEMREYRDKNGYNSRFFNVGYGIEYVTAHEYGHALAASYKLYGSQSKELYDYYMSLDKKDIAMQISSYAAEEWNEMFAEAFVQSLGGPQSDIVDHVMDMLRRAMGK